jgi:antitoxin Phd
MPVQAKHWKLEDAKARFSELVRTANRAGPQHVTVRGKESAVVLSAKDYERLKNAAKRLPLVSFLEGLGLHDLDLTRDPDRGRDVAF